MYIGRIGIFLITMYKIDCTQTLLIKRVKLGITYNNYTQ